MTGLLNARKERRVADAVIRDPEEHTVMDKDGAVRSIQAAYVTVPTEDLERLWTTENLERLARTYWKYLSKVTLGLIRVTYTEDERAVVLLLRPLVLLRFRAPEYEFAPNGDRGIVRWRIENGLLVSPRGRGGARLPGDRRAPAAAGGAGLVDRARRGRGRELLPGDRDLADRLRLLAHAVEDPRDRHPRLPALARAAGARGVGGRALRPEDRRGVRREKDGAITVGETPWGWIAGLAAAGVAGVVALVLWMTRD